MATKARYLYSELARLVQARKGCAETMETHADWFERHTEAIERLVDQHLPHGSGFDLGTKIDLEASHADRLVFHTSFHHMDENGFYDGWTEHTITVKPSLQFGFNLRIGGQGRNEIKDTIRAEFDNALREDVLYDLYVEACPGWKIESKRIDQCSVRYYVKGKEFATFTAAREYAGAGAYEEFMTHPRGRILAP